MDKIIAAIGRFMAQQERLNRKLLKKYPPDPPNPKCRHAIIDGFLLSNSQGIFRPDMSNLANPGEMKKLFRFGGEQLSRWTHKTSEYSVFLSHVDLDISQHKIWRTAGTALRLAVALGSNFEHMQQTRYLWIYDFDRTVPAAQQRFLDDDVPEGGQMHPVGFWADAAAILELLERDESFYVAAQALYSAFEAHWFCLLCALSPAHRRKHEHPEPNVWELADMLPRMEIALVQSTKSIEGLLGKPGDRNSPAKLQRVKARWRDAIDLDPDAEFNLAQQSFIDFYYALFGLRGEAAHSFGKLSLRLSRLAAVQAQSFAWIVLTQYFKKRRIALADAWKKLKFSRFATKRVAIESTTKLTRDSEM